MLGVENMPKFWAFSLWQNADSSPTPWPAGPCSQTPGIYRVQEEAPVCNPTLVRLPPGPQPFPFEAVMLGITERTLCYHPPSHPSLGSASLLLMWKSTSCHHHLCDSPPCYHCPIRVTAIMMTLPCGVMHMITEQYSCCFVQMMEDYSFYLFVLLIVIML